MTKDEAHTYATNSLKSRVSLTIEDAASGGYYETSFGFYSTNFFMAEEISEWLKKMGYVVKMLNNGTMRIYWD